MRNLSLKFTALLGLALAGCSLKSANDDSSLYVDLSGLRDEASRFALLNPSGGFLGLVSVPPVSSGGFACYAVNVMGPGIPDTSSNPDPGDLGLKFNNLWNATDADSHCSYRGIASQTISAISGNPQVVLQVPPGGPRLVQLVGVNDNSVNSACTTGTLDEPPGSTGGSGKYFEVGRAKLNNFFSDQSVDVLDTWPGDATARSKRVLDCGDGCGTISEILPAPAPTSTPLTLSSGQKLAFKIPSDVGKYLRSITVSISTTGASPTVALNIYVAALMGGIASATNSNHGSNMAISVGAPTSVEFSLLGTANDYLQMDATHEYWAVMEMTAGATFSVIHNQGTPQTDVWTFPSVAWVQFANSLGIVNEVYGCSN